MWLKTLIGVSLVYLLNTESVLAETDPLILQLLARVEALEEEGIQQKARIKQLEEEVLVLKTNANICSDCPKVADSVPDNDTGDITDDGVEVDLHANDVVHGENAPNRIKQYRPMTDIEDGKLIPSRVLGNPQRRLIMDTENACFHAVLVGLAHEHNHMDQILVFDSVLLNIGGAYNSKTGIFVTPIQGIYIFSLTVRDVGPAVHIDIMKNGDEIGAAYADSENQGSITVAMQLDIGDTVHASIERHDDVPIWGDKLTSFMGCLITPW